MIDGVILDGLEGVVTAATEAAIVGRLDVEGVVVSSQFAPEIWHAENSEDAHG